ncbi:class I adenylate-forming enzyme family protein [Acetivibrio cellulolyticus]|uniref:class I adenylate-forming enzyme family protein n=1 Tax=Acetivibrio cellulolyticus TaxID=35830 RepID=UPI0001E2C729|nr:class I adenylate-forming enzyme family protein [Acetivibrio cellulolyticus]
MSDSSYRNIYSVIKNYASTYGDKILIAVEDEEVSYSSFITDVDIISNALAFMGITPNKKVGIIIPNSAIWYKIFWAIVKMGAIPVPLDPQIGQWEMERVISLADIEICFVASRYRANNILDNILKAAGNIPTLKNIIATEPEKDTDFVLSFRSFKEKACGCDYEGQVYKPEEADNLMLACTSGSTGNPKIIAVPHIGFYKSQCDMGEYLGFGSSDVMLLGMPLYHQGGFGMGLQMILKGGSVLYQPTFDPEKFLSTIEQKKVTVAQLTTTLAKIILSVPDFDKYDLSSLRMCYFAGEVLPMEVARIFFERLNIRVVNVIGSSETATMVVWDSEYDRELDPNDYRTLPFTKMKVMGSQNNDVSEGEVGTIFIHTDALINEYYKNEQETSLKIRWLDGIKWFDTGDLGEKRQDGRVRFIGRVKRIIKRGSNLIYPEESEAFILTHPNVEAVAVIGEKHELMGEMVVAYIQPKKDCKFTRADLIKFCQGKLAAYKMPDKVVITDELPHDIGKIQFKYIKEQEGQDDK